jgi:hypothetical protein
MIDMLIAHAKRGNQRRLVALMFLLLMPVLIAVSLLVGTALHLVSLVRTYASDFRDFVDLIHITRTGDFQ